jgi:tetratricopeptide (TPR) repeat protein
MFIYLVRDCYAQERAMISFVDKVTLWFDTSIEFALANRRRLILGALGLIGMICAFIAYGYYHSWVQTSAQKAFAEALRYYDAPVGNKTTITNGTIEFGSDEEKWKKVAEVCDADYHKNSRAGIAPFFKTYYADALAHLGKTDQAIEIMAKAVPEIARQELRDFYNVKLALMKLDNPATHTQGLTLLTAVANDRSNTAHEAGLYYLGFYFWSIKNFEQARAYWQQLVVQYDKPDAKQQSGFAPLVKARLKLISAEW